MMVKRERQGRSFFWRPVVLFSLLLVAAFLVRGAAASVEVLPLHGAVAAWAEEHPGEPVPLIVQHDGTPDDLLAFVRESGGSVEREFHIIPALDVEMPAGLVDDLARQDDVNWVSLDAPVRSTGEPAGPVDKSNLATAYPVAVKAEDPWQKGVYGSGVTVALIDTGVSDDAKEDFYDAGGALRVEWVTTNPDLDANGDGFGHGTHVGGIIAGYSTATDGHGEYTGIAPAADLLSVRIADDQGNATVGDLMAGLEFVDDNRATHNIRVLNLSVSSSVAQSYTVDPIDAAVELLWFHGVVVVVAAGNDGTASDAVHYPPANDPFVITVGAFDDAGTFSYGDDEVTPWSSRGTTQDGFIKPDLVAPGANIVSPVSPGSYLATTYPQAMDEQGNEAYFRMSGTSMSTAVLSGVVALVLEKHPDWTPGEIKATLINKGRNVHGEGPNRAPRVGDTNNQSNPKGNTDDDGLTPNYILLAAVLELDEVEFDGIRWRGIRWRDGFEVDFDGIRWRDAIFDGIRWRGLELDGIRWREVDFSGIRWRGVDFSGIRWRGLDFEGIRWRGIRWRAFVED